MDGSGDVMVSDVAEERSDYATPILTKDNERTEPDYSSSSGLPEYSTITRLRQHHPPSYVDHRVDLNDKKEGEDEITEEAETSPVEDYEKFRGEDEDKIEKLDPTTDEDNSKHGSNGHPPGAGWAVGAAGLSMLASSSGEDKADESNDPSKVVAQKNLKILEQYEDKPREKDECLVDCIYYTTTCCECRIL